MRKHISEQSQHFCEDRSISNPNGLESYVVKRTIAKGSKSTVYLATCTRGRLRGRDVALKVFAISLSSSLNATTILHKSLHHPALISLLSTFTTADAHYLILELCEGGTLSDFMCASARQYLGESTVKGLLRLTEAQLRPVARSIVEGLSHLHARGVMHGDINAENIFLTADGRAKLGGFGLSVDTSRTTEDATLNVMFYTEETISKRQYSYSMDLRSLGCLIATLLTGNSLLEADGAPETATFPSAGSYNLPAHPKISKEAENLLHSLLTKEPGDRLPLDKILTHPFFNHSLPTQLILPPLVNRFSGKLSSAPVWHGETHLEDPLSHETIPPKGKKESDLQVGIHATTHKQKALPYRMPSTLRTAVTTPMPSNTSVPAESRVVSCPHPASSSGIKEAWTKLMKHQQPIKWNDGLDPSTSGPVSGTGYMLQKGKRKVLGEVGNRRSSLRPLTQSSAYVERLSPPSRGPKGQDALVSGLLLSPETQCSANLQHRGSQVLPIIPSRSPSAPILRTASTASRQCSRSCGKDAGSILPSLKDESPTAVPRTNIPTPLRVPPLFPQTHKTGHGQLVVMPSRSLLVDLREGERRAGGRGDRVLCISSDGREIKIYDAPHLSTPCMLSEPLSIWSIEELPERYWENYTFSFKYVESVKKRTPLMIWYTTQAKFTLMSNGPEGDVHASFPCPSPTKTRLGSREPLDSFTKMRIKFSRERGVAEISRFMSSADGRGRGEWCTKFLNVAEEESKRGGDLRLKLTHEELEGLECVIQGLKVCEAVEEQCMDAMPNGEEKDRAWKNRPDHRDKPLATESPARELGSRTQEREAWTLPGPKPEVSTSVPRVVSGSPLSIAPPSAAGRKNEIDISGKSFACGP